VIQDFPLGPHTHAASRHRHPRRTLTIPSAASRHYQLNMLDLRSYNDGRPSFDASLCIASAALIICARLTFKAAREAALDEKLNEEHYTGVRLMCEHMRRAVDLLRREVPQDALCECCIGFHYPNRLGAYVRYGLIIIKGHSAKVFLPKTKNKKKIRNISMGILTVRVR
jgi:hypothetical protein